MAPLTTGIHGLRPAPGSDPGRPACGPLVPEARLGHRGGFSLIEVVVAMLLLTVGLLGLAAGTGWVLRSTEGARIDTARATALQSAVEQVRALDDATLAEGGALELPGAYEATWEPMGAGVNSTQVRIILRGERHEVRAGGALPTLAPAAVDTLLYRVVR